MDLQSSRKLLYFFVSTLCILSANACKIQIVESIPEGLVYPEGSLTYPSAYSALKQLIQNSKKSIDIAMNCWTLRRIDTYNHSSAWQGEDIFNGLLDAGLKRNISIRIMQDEPVPELSMHVTEILAEKRAAKVRTVNMTRLMGSGLFHTKLWIVDGKDMYFGSANTDWRSLTQVKELGVYITDCPVLAKDAQKISDLYWEMGAEDAILPRKWPKIFSTKINALNPIPINFTNGFTLNTYISNAPPSMNPTGRTHDMDAVLNVIKKAKRFIHISLMDYIPVSIYRNIFYPVFEYALRAAAIDQRVSMKLLVSSWPLSCPAIDYFLNSLISISDEYEGVDIQVKRFIIPITEEQAKIPFVQINRNKFMVTDNSIYISNSNWSDDHFTDTTGIGLIFEEMSTNETQSIRAEVERIFERDWNSEYAIVVESPIPSIDDVNTENSKGNSSACKLSKYTIGLVPIAWTFIFLCR